MGSYLSCSMATGAGVGPARVIFPSGETKKFASPTNIAELMLDVPNHFVASTAEMEIGRRFSALPADEELEVGGVYVMVPMGRLNSIVTSGDMGFLVTTPAASRKTSTVVVPEEDRGAVAASAGLRLDDVEGITVTELSMLRCRTLKSMKSCKSRKQTLETIVEENSVITSSSG